MAKLTAREKHIHEMNTMVAICKRAQTLGIAQGTQMTQMMDVGNAHKQFNLNLVAMLEADDANFAHDFCGIQRNMNRVTGMIENYFVPRFSSID